MFDKGGKMVAALIGPDGPKIDQPNASVLCQKNVVRTDIPVDKAGIMNLLQGIHQGPQNGHQLRPGH